MRRVAFLTGNLVLGGTTTFLLNLIPGLREAGWDARVWSTTWDSPLQEDFEARGIPLIRRNEKRFIYEDQMRQTLNELAEFQPEIVVAAHHAVTYEILRHLPPGVHKWGVVQTDDEEVYLHTLKYEDLLQGIVAVSAHVSETLQGRRKRKALRIETIPYGVAFAEENVAIEPLPGEPLRILYHGRLEKKQKRVHLFPEIARLLGDSGLPLHWTIVGHGEEHDFLQSALANPGGQLEVEMHPPCHYREIPKLLMQHHLYLLTSDYEGLPLSLLEAMSHGLVPVVTQINSGIREVVGPANGFLVPPDQTAAYAEAILLLARNPELLPFYASKARETIRNGYTVTHMTRRWNRLLSLLPTVGPQVWKGWKPGRIQKPLFTQTPNWAFTLPGVMLRRLVKRLQSS
jgi:glycosyltransferase involved in cell wall biosynthesis